MRRCTPIPRFALTLLLASAACGGDSPAENNTPDNPPPPEPAANDIIIVVGAQSRTTTAFSPNPKNVSLGGNSSVSVRFVNTDISGGDYTEGTAVVHRIAGDDGSFNTGNLGGNATYSVTFTTAGTYAYHCENHPNMVGTIQVDP